MFARVNVARVNVDRVNVARVNVARVIVARLNVARVNVARISVACLIRMRFTKQFGCKTSPKVCNKVTNFWGKFHPQSFCETYPRRSYLNGRKQHSEQRTRMGGFYRHLI